MIQVMLREPDELRERGIRRVINDRLKQMLDWECPRCCLHAGVERMKRRDVALPVLFGRCGQRRPVFMRQKRRGIALETSKDKMIAAGEVKNELPAAMRAGHRMSRSLARSDSFQAFPNGGAVPRGPFHAAPQLVLQSLEDSGSSHVVHCASPPDVALLAHIMRLHDPRESRLWLRRPSVWLHQGSNVNRPLSRRSHGFRHALLLAAMAGCADAVGVSGRPADSVVRFIVTNELAAPVTIAIDDTVSLILASGASS